MKDKTMKGIKSVKHTLLLIIGVLSLLNVQLYSQQNDNDKKYIKIDVDGLACPFCAYGIEKNLRSNIEGLDNLDINIEKGFVTFGFPKQTKLEDKKIRDIIKDAGFQPNKIAFSDKPFTKIENNK